MRKITELTTDAFIHGTPLRVDNTTVNVDGETVELRLFGNLIARKNKNHSSFEISNAGWSTKTTKERLNGLPGVKISQVNGHWFLNGFNKWDGSWITITP